MTGPAPDDGEAASEVDELRAEVGRLRARVARLESEKADLLRAKNERDFEPPPHYR